MNELLRHPVELQRVCRFAGIRVTVFVFALSLASAFCLRASRVAPVRAFVWRLRGAGVAVVCLPLRWHPRFAFVLQAS
ncbi:hypothetical protein CA602_39785, partial [Paraburkholderia hospita]